MKGFEAVLLGPDRLEVRLPKDTSLNCVFEQLNGIGVSGMRNKSNRLEELFMDLVGKKVSL